MADRFIFCPVCGRKLRVANTAARINITCPVCGEQYILDNGRVVLDEKTAGMASYYNDTAAGRRALKKKEKRAQKAARTPSGNAGRKGFPWRLLVVLAVLAVLVVLTLNDKSESETLAGYNIPLQGSAAELGATSDIINGCTKLKYYDKEASDGAIIYYDGVNLISTTGATGGDTQISSDSTHYTYEAVHAELSSAGRTPLFRNTYYDSVIGADLSELYEYIEFAAYSGCSRIIVAMDDACYHAVQNTKVLNMFTDLTIKKSWYTLTDGRHLGVFTLKWRGFDDFDAGLERQLKADEFARMLVNEMPASCKTEEQKVHYFYDWLTQNVKYDEETAAYEGSEDNLSPYYSKGDYNFLYDTLIKRNAVCSGYAYTLAYLCRLAGWRRITGRCTTMKRA